MTSAVTAESISEATQNYRFGRTSGDWPAAGEDGSLGSAGLPRYCGALACGGPCDGGAAFGEAPGGSP